MTNLHKKVYVLIGEASLCWSESPQGIFDSTKALEIGDKFILELSKLEKVAEAARPLVRALELCQVCNQDEDLDKAFKNEIVLQRALKELDGENVE